MFGNLLTAAVIIAIFWIVIFVAYMVVSRQQRSIADEINEIQQDLKNEPENS